MHRRRRRCERPWDSFPDRYISWSAQAFGRGWHWPSDGPKEPLGVALEFSQNVRPGSPRSRAAPRSPFHSQETSGAPPLGTEIRRLAIRQRVAPLASVAEIVHPRCAGQSWLIGINLLGVHAGLLPELHQVRIVSGDRRGKSLMLRRPRRLYWHSSKLPTVLLECKARSAAGLYRFATRSPRRRRRRARLCERAGRLNTAKCPRSGDPRLDDRISRRKRLGDRVASDDPCRRSAARSVSA